MATKLEEISSINSKILELKKKKNIEELTEKEINTIKKLEKRKELLLEWIRKDMENERQNFMEIVKKNKIFKYGSFILILISSIILTYNIIYFMKYTNIRNTSGSLISLQNQTIKNFNNGQTLYSIINNKQINIENKSFVYIENNPINKNKFMDYFIISDFKLLLRNLNNKINQNQYGYFKNINNGQIIKRTTLIEEQAAIISLKVLNK